VIDCVVADERTKLRARHAVLSNRSLWGREGLCDCVRYFGNREQPCAPLWDKQVTYDEDCRDGCSRIV